MKFIKKHAMPIIVVVLVALFVLLAVLLKDTSEPKASIVDEWLKDTKENGYVVSVYAQTTCSHCHNFKPIIDEVHDEYGFNLYWFDLDTMKRTDYNTITNTYEMTDYAGTPYTLITNNGEVVSYKSGEMSKSALEELLTTAGVIEK